jgi:hypothetical protein
MYTDLWHVKVPPKVRVFGWKVATDCLATQVNRRNRALVDSAVCTICGMEEETSHHALVSCPRAVALRQEMRSGAYRRSRDYGIRGRTGSSCW